MRDTAQREAQSSATWATGLLGSQRAAASAAPLVLGRVVVGVAQAEEPHQPDDEESDVEDPKTDHPDPSLGVHGRDGSATAKAA